MPPIENKPHDDLTDLLVEEPSIKDDQIERLQTQLNDERDARLEERFVYIVILVILLDVVFFSIMQNSTLKHLIHVEIIHQRMPWSSI